MHRLLFFSLSIGVQYSTKTGHEAQTCILSQIYIQLKNGKSKKDAILEGHVNIRSCKKFIKHF